MHYLYIISIDSGVEKKVYILYNFVEIQGVHHQIWNSRYQREAFCKHVSFHVKNDTSWISQFYIPWLSTTYLSKNRLAYQYVYFEFFFFYFFHNFSACIFYIQSSTHQHNNTRIWIFIPGATVSLYLFLNILIIDEKRNRTEKLNSM